MDEIKNDLYTIFYEQIGEAPATALWKHCMQFSDLEIEDLHGMCAADPKFVHAITKLYAAQLIAIKSCNPADRQTVIDRSEALLERVEKMDGTQQ